MKDYLIDSSVWIDYFRNANPTMANFVDNLIDENRVYINGIILTELLSGARSQKEVNTLTSTLNGLHFTESNRSRFEKAGLIGYRLKRLGVSVPLSDVLIACDCLEENLMLLDNDRHFAFIAKHLPLKRHSK
jgi:predicted nucleic acid-binding protein